MLDNFEGKKDISWNAFFVQEYHVYGLASEHDAKTLKNMLLNVYSSTCRSGRVAH